MCCRGIQWNADHRASNWLLINLQRHSDHHSKPDRRFPLLQTYGDDDAPQLPFGYPMMTMAALVPPLWRRMMNPQGAGLAAAVLSRDRRLGAVQGRHQPAAALSGQAMLNPCRRAAATSGAIQPKSRSESLTLTDGSAVPIASARRRSAGIRRGVTALT